MKTVYLLTLFFTLVTGFAFSEGGNAGHTQVASGRDQAEENCAEATRFACAFLEGCRVGYAACDPKVLATSTCWTEMTKQIVTQSTAQCSQWVYVNSARGTPIECYVGKPKRDANGNSPQSFLLSELRKKAKEKDPN